MNSDRHIADTLAKNSAARLSVLTAAFLILLKTAAGLLTGSISIWASLLDSAMDIFASTVNFLAVRASALPADEHHTYGHGKVESLAGLFQALVISASGLFLIFEAWKRIRVPHALQSEYVGIGTMVIAIGVSTALVARLRKIAHQTDSPALASDAVHYASDIITNAGALLALAAVRLTGLTLIDPSVSILISLYILASAVRVAKESIDVLMDRRLPAEVEEQVASIIARFHNEGVYGFHDIRTRRSGSYKFIDLHLEVDNAQSLMAAHGVTVRVIHAIEAEIPRSKVHVHTDPVARKG